MVLTLGIQDILFNNKGQGMTEEEIKARLEDAVEVIMRMPDDIRKMDYKSTMPEIIRREWLDFNTESAKANFYRLPRPTPEQVTKAMECEEWMRYAASRREESIRQVIMSTLYLKSSGCGYRKAADLIEKATHKRYSYETLRRWYDRAIDDICVYARSIT